MLDEDHEKLLIAVSRKGGSANVDHLALRAGLPLKYWRRIARELQEHGYGDTYDRGRSFHVNHEGVVEAKRLLTVQNAPPPPKPPPAASASPSPSCQRCGHTRRPSGRFCAHCGLRYAD